MMKKTEMRLPDNYKLLREEDNQPISVDEGDNSIPEATMEKLKNEKVYIMYSSYKFCGTIWWDKKSQELKMEPWRYQIRGYTTQGRNLEELIDNYLMNR